jgi:hypothetical protein
MPKKSKPVKDKPKKKAMKPKTPSKKTIKAKPAVTIIKPTPCCTDVLKTGQAYTVPLGFMDYKGTQRINQIPPVSTPSQPPKVMTADANTQATKPKVSTSESFTQVDTIRILKAKRPVRLEEPTITTEPIKKKISIIRPIPLEEATISTQPTRKNISIIRPLPLEEATIST